MTTEIKGAAVPAPAAIETTAAGAEVRPSTPRVVVLGGGVAGLTAAYELRRRLRDHAQITLIADSDRFRLGLGLLWVPFGRRPDTLNFPLAPALERQGIRLLCAYRRA